MRFSAQQEGLSHLGTIIENHLIREVLWQKVTSHSDITCYSPLKLNALCGEEKMKPFISLNDGEMLTARLVVGADGANSWLRKMLIFH